MSSILKVDQLQDSGGNAIITSNGSGTITVNSQPFKNGITEADQWRLTTNIVGGGSGDINANLERVDDATFAKIGTGMTESSGIFSFPSTGLYHIFANVFFNSKGNDSFGDVYTQVSTDGGSTYDSIAIAEGGNNNNAEVNHTVSSQNLINVTNISNFRVKFRYGSLTYNDILGNTGINYTSFTFVRLGDSQ